MEHSSPFVRLTLDVKRPIELGEFVGAFTALGAEYDRFLKQDGPTNLGGTLYVREVRQGSIVADIITVSHDVGQVYGALRPVIDFVKIYGHRLKSYTRPGGRTEGASKSELQGFSEQVAAIASTPGSRLRLAAMTVERGEERTHAAFSFDTEEARDMQGRIEDHRLALNHTSRGDRDRVLMVFTRSDVSSAPVGQRSGERVLIESISSVPRPLIYASELAEGRIKHEITEEPDNVYKKGFVVDVNVETRNGKPVAYSVTAVHQVIDLEG